MVLHDDRQLKNFVPNPHATKKLCPKFFNDFFTVAKKLFQKLKLWLQKRNLLYKYEKLKDKWIKVT